MGTALQASGRDIVYSCSWPAYLGGNESAKPFDLMIQAGCNSWRNWEDIQCDWGVLSNIIDHWGRYTAVLQAWAGRGHWHDPDVRETPLLSVYKH
jgi:alpha-N-acetylgalactosaminidase